MYAKYNRTTNEVQARTIGYKSYGNNASHCHGKNKNKNNKTSDKEEK